MFFAVSGGLVDGAAHGVGHFVSVNDGAAFEVAGGAVDDPDEKLGSGGSLPND